MRWLLVFAIFFICGLSLAETATDRSAMYPPASPLWGQTTDGRPAVLWYEAGRLYNSNPDDALYARSHWDEIAWEGRWLIYRATEAVAPLTPRRVEFTDGIRYLPRTGDREWHGSTRFTSESGDGLAVYAGSIREGVMPSDGAGFADDDESTTSVTRPPSTFLRIDELLLWDSGWVTTWNESYEFRDGRLWHAWGGNATGADRWDIMFTEKEVR